MLRVGLTGSLGSGKSTVAAILRELGAEVIEADELGRTLMEPGQAVFAEILRVFGPEVAGSDGRLNRTRLAELAFREGRLQDLNGIVHPAVISAQRDWMQEVFRRNPAAVAVVESALIFEVARDAGARGDLESGVADWHRHFNRLVVVTAPDEIKIARYADRVCPDGTGREVALTEARHRLAHQIPDTEKAANSDYVIENNSNKSELRSQVERIWKQLKEESNSFL